MSVCINTNDNIIGYDEVGIWGHITPMETAITRLYRIFGEQERPG